MAESVAMPNGFMTILFASMAVRIWTASLILGFLAIPFTAALRRIWGPGRRAKPLLDRVAWTIFALGVHAMFFVALQARASEGDGDFRSWRTIRLQRWLLAAFAMMAVAGPLIVVLRQAYDAQRRWHSTKKPVSDFAEMDHPSP